MEREELPAVTVSDLYQANKLNFRRGHYNILDCGVRTGKTYWAIHNLQDYTRDQQLNRILFLVNTSILKDQIIHDYGDQCIDADDIWERTSEKWGEVPNKIGVMCYQRLGMRAMKRDLRLLEHIDVICWDECDSIFDFAAQAFATARDTDFAREDISNAEVLSAIQQYSTKKEYMPLVLLGVWEDIIHHENILCIGLSASPERAQRYYYSLVNTSYQGKIDAGYRAADTIYFTNIYEHIMRLRPEPERGYWCYSPYIEPNKGIVALAREQGFNAIEIHSPKNEKYPLTEEQQRVYNIIGSTHMVPYEYDFIVVNAALKSGITIEDRRFDQVIVNSLQENERIQAARQTFPYHIHLRVWAGEIPTKYLNRWLTVPECRELAEYMAVSNLDKQNKNTSKILTWNGLKEYLPSIGYTVQSARKRLNGKQQQCYYIEGEWHDVLPDDNLFMKLAAAKSEQLEE